MNQKLCATRKALPRRTLLIAALIAVLALSVTALAVSRAKVLDFLFPDEPPPPEAQALVEPLDQSGSTGQVTATIGEAVRDGNTLSVTWSFESTLDAPILIDFTQGYVSATVDDERLDWTGGSGGSDLGAIVLGGSVNGFTFERSCEGMATFQVPKAFRNALIDVTLSARAYTSLGEFGFFDWDAFEEGTVRFADAQRLYVDKYGQTAGYSHPGVDSALRAYHAAHDVDMDDPDHYCEYDVLIEWGLLKPYGWVEARARVAPVGGNVKTTRIVGQDTFDFGDFTLVVKEASLSTVSGVVELRLYPADGQAWTWDDASRVPSFTLLRPNGKELPYWMDGSPEVDETGASYYSSMYKLNAVTKIPPAIVIAPQAFNADGTGYDVDMEKAVTVTIE